MAEGDGGIRIDIEVSTQSLKEIQDILKEIRAADEKLQRIKTDTTTERLRKRRGGVPEVGASPEDIARVQDERGGVFGGQTGGLPTKGRDRTSKAPVQMENRFRKLEEDVEEQRDILSTITGLGGTATGLLGTLKRGGPISLIEKIFKNPLAKAFIAITIAQLLIEQIADILQSPGNLFDRRYRRMIKDEISGLTPKAEKAAIRQGFRTIIVTTRPGLRGGRGQISSTQDPLSSQSGLYDVEQEMWKVI